MIGSTIQAADEIVDLLKAKWEAALELPNLPFTMPDRASWARLRIFHNDGEQNSLSDVEGARLFGSSGSIVVQCFSPLGEGLKRAYDEADLVVAAFRGKRTPGDVWFRRVRKLEVGSDGKWWQINVEADFTYDERV